MRFIFLLLTSCRSFYIYNSCIVVYIVPVYNSLVRCMIFCKYFLPIVWVAFHYWLYSLHRKIYFKTFFFLYIGVLNFDIVVDQFFYFLFCYLCFCLSFDMLEIMACCTVMELSPYVSPPKSFISFSLGNSLAVH